jgi:solute carrier family 20 (sodium-dependent phosphate transporter)
MPDQLADRYTWLIVTGAFGAFGFGWGTGSNDVANAFGTSVGAKTLTLRQAVMLAVVFEFTGAIVLGRVSAETIAGGIAKAETFKTNAPLYAYGMSIVLWLGFLWQAFASYMGWNVSATHSIIGGIIGFAMVWGGGDSVFWAEPDSTKIPPIKGVVPIIISWFFSPVLTGCASALFYGLTRYFVLLSEHSTERSYYVLPIMVFFTILIDIYFTFTKGAKKSFSSSDDWSDAKALWISVVIAAGCSLFSLIFGIPFLRRKLRQKQESDAADRANNVEKGTGGDVVVLQNLPPAAPEIDPVTLKTVEQHEVIKKKIFLPLYFTLRQQSDESFHPGPSSRRRSSGPDSP